jgi:hypothetical protein
LIMRSDPTGARVGGSRKARRELMQPDGATDEAIVVRWREASSAEHGRVLWGLLEFADCVQRGRATAPPPEPLGALPTPLGHGVG